MMRIFTAYIGWLLETQILGVSRPLPTLKVLQNFWFSVNNEYIIHL